MARHFNNVESGSSKKSHRKKKKLVYDSNEKHVQTVSNLPEQEHEEKVQDTAKKFDSTSNADERVKGRLSDSSHQETSDSTVKRKSGKKRKRLHDEAKKNKIKRNADTDASADVNTEHTNTATSNCAQYHALEYLRTWKSARDRWTFQKVRQVWLLQHMYDSAKVTACHICSLVLVIKKHDGLNLLLVFYSCVYFTWS